MPGPIPIHYQGTDERSVIYQPGITLEGPVTSPYGNPVFYFSAWCEGLGQLLLVWFPFVGKWTDRLANEHRSLLRLCKTCFANRASIASGEAKRTPPHQAGVDPSKSNWSSLVILPGARYPEEIRYLG